MAKKEIIEDGKFNLTVKAVLLNEEGKVLVLKRANGDKSGSGNYDLPGGGIGKEENLEDALKREIKEETNLEAEIGPVVYAFDFNQNFNPELGFGKGIRFIAYVKDGEIKLDPKEHGDFEWLDIDKAIDKFSAEGFEMDKKGSLINAKKYLEREKALDSWKRCMADFENFKKRQSEQQVEIIKYANQNLILDIIPVLDNFHASTDHIPEDQKDNAWVIGIMYIQKQLEKVLSDNGVEEIETKVGDKFNPEVHEAVENKEAKEKELKHKIKKVILKGYRMSGKIIRATRVIVE